MVSPQWCRPHAQPKTPPTALAIAVACATLSVAGHFQPGYIYGLIAGYAVLHTRQVTVPQEARAVLLGTGVIAAVSLLCWILWEPIDTALNVASSEPAQQL